MAEGYEPKPIADLKSVTYSGTTIYNGGYNLYSDVGISVSSAKEVTFEMSIFLRT